MPNRNYLAGVRFERELMKEWEGKGFRCIRASGSHGDYDIVAFRPDQKPNFIQAKVTDRESTRQAMFKSFLDTPPAVHYHQSLAVKLKGKDVQVKTI